MITLSFVSLVVLLSLTTIIKRAPAWSSAQTSSDWSESPEVAQISAHTKTHRTYSLRNHHLPNWQKNFHQSHTWEYFSVTWQPTVSSTEPVSFIIVPTWHEETLIRGRNVSVWHKLFFIIEWMSHFSFYLLPSPHLKTESVITGQESTRLTCSPTPAELITAWTHRRVNYIKTWYKTNQHINDFNSFQVDQLKYWAWKETLQSTSTATVPL